MNSLEHQIKLYQERAWPNATFGNTFRKLCEEVGELGEALMRGSERDIAEELGDVGMVLAGLGIKHNKSLTVCMATALDKCESRLINK